MYLSHQFSIIDITTRKMCWNIGELESRLRSSCLATEKIYSVLRRQPAFNTAIAVSVAGYSTRFVPVNAPCGQRPPSRCSQIRSLSCRSQNQTRTAHIPPLCPHRVALRLQYDGTSFHGWERKPDHAAVSTIQATVEAGLSEVYGTQIRAQAASRTDAGAHALAQVIHFDAPFALSSYS